MIYTTEMVTNYRSYYEMEAKNAKVTKPGIVIESKIKFDIKEAEARAAKIKLYREYEKKSEIEGTYHSLIYGSIINNDQFLTIKETDLFKKFSLYLYGYDGGDKFIGFEFDRIYGLYDHLHYSYGDKLSFSQAVLPTKIPELFKATYPELTGYCQAIIQNVRCSHYTSGNVMHGYWLDVSETHGNTDEWIDEIHDIAMCGDDWHKNNKYGGENNEFWIEVMSVGHNMKDTNSVPSEYFVGFTLERFAANEGDEDHPNLAAQLLTSYSIENSRLSSRDVVLQILKKIHPGINTHRLSKFPMICLIQGMCYCCT